MGLPKETHDSDVSRNDKTIVLKHTYMATII